MNMVAPNEGKTLLLKWALDDTGLGLEDMHLDLFSSNTTVGDASTAADFTIATFSGYAQITITRADWADLGITSNVAYRGVTPAPAFTCTGGSPQTVYGWILRSASTGKVLLGQNFDTARTMAGGATETLDPFKVGLKTLV